MNDVVPNGGTAQHAVQPAGPQTRVAVIIGGQPGQIGECRIDDPDRVLRVWSMLSASDRELHQASVPPGVETRLVRQLHAIAAELERSMSPALTAELERLLRLSGSEGPTSAELKVEYAGVLGWMGGLVVAILRQLEEASARRSAAPGPDARRGHSRRAPSPDAGAGTSDSAPGGQAG